jgi:hypothetical protein
MARAAALCHSPIIGTTAHVCGVTVRCRLLLRRRRRVYEQQMRYTSDAVEHGFDVADGVQGCRLLPTV